MTESKLIKQLEKNQWFKRLEKRDGNNYIIWCDYYPYSEDGIVQKLQIKHNVNLILKSIGNR